MSDLLTVLISSSLDSERDTDVTGNLSVDNASVSDNAIDIYKIEIISEHHEQSIKAKAVQEQFDLSHVPVKPLHTKSVILSTLSVVFGSLLSCIGHCQQSRIYRSMN